MSTQPEPDTRAVPVPTPPSPPRGPSTATVVWGLALLSLAAIAGLSELTSWDVDPTLALPAVLLGAGVLLVLAAVVAVFRRRGGDGADDGLDDRADSGLDDERA